MGRRETQEIEEGARGLARSGCGHMQGILAPPFSITRELFPEGGKREYEKSYGEAEGEGVAVRQKVGGTEAQKLE